MSPRLRRLRKPLPPPQLRLRSQSRSLVISRDQVVRSSTPSLYEQVRVASRRIHKLRRVNAYTNGGTVTLFGKVFGEGEKSLAEETVRNLPGVTSVVDNITTDEAEWAEEQTQIAQQLANSGLGKVTVKVIGHDAFLDGEVKTELEKSRAVTITEGAAPVTVREQPDSGDAGEYVWLLRNRPRRFDI